MSKVKLQSTKAQAAASASAQKPPPPSPKTPIHTPPLFRRIDWVTLLITTLVVFVGYYLTLAPNLTLEDSGELAVGSYYAGIPHPPGYPIWTMYTWLATVILPISNIAWRVAMASAFAGALSCGLLAFLVSRGSSMMIEGIAELKDFDRRWENAICVVSGFVSGMLLGFNGFMWSQSVIVEVYSFCVLSLMAVLLFLLRWTYAPHQYRYLCLAFFLHGICFNNHQSLLVAALGMEVLVIVVQPKMARELFFWNMIVYFGGLVVKPSVLTSNTPVFVIFNIIGIASVAVWIWLAIKTKLQWVELGRDLLIAAAFGMVGLFLGGIMHYVLKIGDSKQLMMLVGVLTVAAIGGAVAMIRSTTFLSKEWLVTLGCGGSWLAGAAFYLYMPLAGMSNPPMEWGYPRTVEGFFHAFTRGQYEKIHPTSGVGNNIIEQTVSLCLTYGKQMWMYLQGMNDEFNLVYLLIALLLLFLYRKMQARERAWLIGVGAIYFCLGPFLVLLLNPGLDRQSISLNRVFFTASHVMVAMCVGYGLTLIATMLASNYKTTRLTAIFGSLVALDMALYSVAVATHSLFGGALGNEPGFIYGFLKFVFAALACACAVLIVYRLFFADTAGQHQFLLLSGLFATGAICLFTIFPFFLNADNGIESNTATGFAKLLCWVVGGIALYFAGQIPGRSWRRYTLMCTGAILAVVSVSLTVITILGNQIKLQNLSDFLGSIVKAFQPDQYALPVYAGLIVLVSTIVFIIALLVWRNRSPLALTLVLFAAMPLYSVLSHWADNEQHGHLFGYWFGHDMFTPPFTGPDGKLTYDPNERKQMMQDPEKAKSIYPEMARNAVLYGGTDPGRFCPTYMIFCESFIPPDCKIDTDPNFDRRDVYIITQNALADGTYLNYIRAQYDRSAQKAYGLDTPFFQELARGPSERLENYETNIIARMVSPLDTLFTGIGESIEKRRRAGSSFFKESDFKDLKSFVGKIRAQTNYVAGQVSAALSAETRALFSSDDEQKLRTALARDLDGLLEKGLYDDTTLAQKMGERWNAVFASDAVVNEKRRVLQNQLGAAAMRQVESLAAQAAARIKSIDAELDTLTDQIQSQLETNGVPVSPYLKAFIRQAPQSFTRIRLTRLLLEAAFPDEIAVSKGGVYPDREIYIASPTDSQQCFDDYLQDAQRRAQSNQLKSGEDVKVQGGKVQVSGQVAVMAINGLITKVMFDHNPENEFYVEESFPLDWMYSHLTPYGVIMKINRQPLPTLTNDILDRDHEFWSKYSDRLIGNWITYDTPISNIVAFVEKVYLRHDWSGLTPEQRQFVRDDQAQKAFSKLRSSIGGVYAWRINTQIPPPVEYRPKTTEEFQRIYKEADFTFRQAFAFCPYSPEAVFRYVNLLIQSGRLDEALLVAQTCLKLDPYSGAAENLVQTLTELKARSAQVEGARKQLLALQTEVRTNPSNFPAYFQLASAYMQMNQPALAEQILDSVLDVPSVGADVAMSVFRHYVDAKKWDKVERTLEKMTNIMPNEPEVWFDLAGIKASTGSTTDSLNILTHALDLNNNRLATNPAAKDLRSEARQDPRFNSLRQMPEFQKLVEPQ